MSVTGNDQPTVPLRRGEESTLQTDKPRVDPVQRVTNPEFKIGGDLVVAAPRRVQFPADVSQLLDQCRFDMHVDIFALEDKRKVLSLNLSLNFRQSEHNLLAFLGCEQTDPREHPRVRGRSLDVVLEKTTIKGDRFRELFHSVVGSGSETATPSFLNH